MGLEVRNNVIKRNGQEVTFDITKIINAITKANNEVDRIHQMNVYQIEAIADNVTDQIRKMDRAVHVRRIRLMTRS